MFFGRIITAREDWRILATRGSETVIQKKREKCIPDRQIEIPRIVIHLFQRRVFFDR